MPRSLEDTSMMLGSVKMQPLRPRGFLSVPEYEEAKLQLPAERKEILLMGPESFMSCNVKESFMSLNVRSGTNEHARTGGQIPHEFFPTYGKLKMLTSEACHKNYVIFDQCEGKSTIILHPSRLKSPPGNSTPEPCFAGQVTHCGDRLQIYDRKWTEDKFDFCSSAALSIAELRPPFCNDATGMQLQQDMASRNESKYRLTDLVPTQRSENNNLRSDFLSEIEEESSEEFHENTEEIDALLSSDDELSSTGHSPSGVSSNHLCEAKNGHDFKVSGKKRKLGHCTLDEADDADSGPYNPERNRFADNKRASNCISSQVVSKSKHANTFSGVAANRASNRTEKRSSADDVFAEKRRCKLMECSGTFRGGRTDRCQRTRIKSNVQQLREVLPGGDCLDTAGVLGKTIQYVKCLQGRLREMKAAR